MRFPNDLTRTRQSCKVNTWIQTQWLCSEDFWPPCPSRSCMLSDVFFTRYLPMEKCFQWVSTRACLCFSFALVASTSDRTEKCDAHLDQLSSQIADGDAVKVLAAKTFLYLTAAILYCDRSVLLVSLAGHFFHTGHTLFSWLTSSACVYWSSLFLAMVMSRRVLYDSTQYVKSYSLWIRNVKELIWHSCSDEMT